jgi:hypothetical protein
MALEPMDKPAAELFFPGVLNDGLMTNRVMLLNTDRGADASLTVRYRAVGQPPVEQAVHVRNDSTLELDLNLAPRGLIGIQVLGRAGATVVGAVYSYGASGGASAMNPATAASRQLTLPVLYRRSGPDSSLDSVVRVMNVREGGTQPRITFIEHETGRRVGPVRTDQVLREGEVVEWALPAISGLTDGKAYVGLVEADGTEPLAGAAITQSSRGINTAYAAVEAGSTEVDVPVVYRRAEGLDSTFLIYNNSGGEGSYSITYRNARGDQVLVTTGRLPASRTASLTLSSVTNLPDGFVGAAEVTTTTNMSVLVSTVRLVMEDNWVYIPAAR